LELKKTSKKPFYSEEQNSKVREVIASYNPKVVVKFRDHVELPYEDKIGGYIQNNGIGPWDRLLKEFPGITINRLITSLKTEEVLGLVARAKERNPDYHPPNFLSFFVVECPPDLDPQLLARALGSWGSVEIAYVASPPGPPPQITYPPNDPRWGQQGYLDPAPDGIDAEFGWKSQIKGSTGEGIQLIDVEKGWMLNHEDLDTANIPLISGLNSATDKDHGAAVLGIICAMANNKVNNKYIGVVGIAPNANVKVVSNSTGVLNAIWTAMNNLNFGDVMLLELQTGGSYLPVEIDYSESLAIGLATALGIVVIEAAGNGQKDLDHELDAYNKEVLNRNNTNDFRDSGAIMVAAGKNSVPHDRKKGGVGSGTNWGSRIDCYAWGEGIETCWTYDQGVTSDYTSVFGGTSGASAIIAGAALVVQGVAEKNLGYRFSPLQLRSLLSDKTLGTPCEHDVPVMVGPDPGIGVMPDLKKIIAKVLNVPADVYIRDFVGDKGDPHVGAISASPDVILLPATQKVAKPQQEFGENSGTENDNSLGYEVQQTDANIYVRVRNRGGMDASNVAADVYWSKAATLLTPDYWTHIGKTTIANVPSGDILTVSDAITWSANKIPAPGHYCFVALIGNEEDPAPLKAEFWDWSDYCRFIRENNNVTWRNFNIVGNTPPPPPSPMAPGLPWGVSLPFFATGAPDMGRIFGLEVVARLPVGSRAWLEAPFHFVQRFGLSSRVTYWDKKRKVAYVPLNPYGRTVLGEALFPEKSETPLKFVVSIPRGSRDARAEIFVSQTFEKEEVGRITWRLVSDKVLKKRERYLKSLTTK
jgi:serine protease